MLPRTSRELLPRDGWEGEAWVPRDRSSA